MDKFALELELEALAHARREWETAIREYRDGHNYILRRLLHEAAANRLSPEWVARHLGTTAKQVRAAMRRFDLNVKKGKILLSKQASEALHSNAEIMGIDPREMDLMSPLAYLPMGAEMRKRFLETRTRTDLPEEDDEL